MKKHYPKTYEDPLQDLSHQFHKIGAVEGTTDELVEQWRSFFRESYCQLFDMYVREVWLEQQFKYSGYRRIKRWGNGHWIDKVFGAFLRQWVGIDQHPMVASFAFTVVASYFKEMFPDFLNHNPFKEPEYYKFPFKHITIDFMCYVYMYEDRMELLRYADEKQMSYHDFINFASNHVLSYNDEIGWRKYVISSFKYMWPYIKLDVVPRGHRDEYFNFKYDDKT